MPTPLIWKRLQIAAKLEGTEGTAEVLTASEAILASNVSYEPVIDMIERPVASSSLSPFPKVAAGRQARITFDVELKGSGTAGTAPEYGVLNKACGMGEIIVAGVSVTYLTASASIITVTIGWYVDGKKYVVAGCRGNRTLELKTPGIGVYHYEFLGTAIDDADVALLSGVSYQTTVPVPFQNATFTLDSVAAVIEGLNIDLGNVLNLRKSGNAAQGYVSAIISDRMPKITLNPEDVLVATKDWWATWEAGSTVALSTVIGSVAGNICTITAPKVQIIGMKPVERDGAVVQEMECGAKRNAGDDEISEGWT
jgi:hypothetical protein